MLRPRSAAGRQSLLAAPRPLRRHLLPLLARLGQPDRNRLLAALHPAAFAASTTLRCPTLVASHLVLDVGAGAPRISPCPSLGHIALPGQSAAKTTRARCLQVGGGRKVPFGAHARRGDPFTRAARTQRDYLFSSMDDIRRAIIGRLALSLHARASLSLDASATRLQGIARRACQLPAQAVRVVVHGDVPRNSRLSQRGQHGVSKAATRGRLNRRSAVLLPEYGEHIIIARPGDRDTTMLV